MAQIELFSKVLQLFSDHNWNITKIWIKQLEHYRNEVAVVHVCVNEL